MPGNSEIDYWDDISDPVLMANRITASFDVRVNICRSHIEYVKLLKVIRSEETKRLQNPTVRDAYEQYQMLLKLVKEEHDLL
ncbi:MAG: hypothetical protein DRQ47_04485 [Gammaproteobacteria bacterium]|nr:MAG: hypothetical protein DRQ47_04485 [Gammaproteobacteria bacterium]